LEKRIRQKVEAGAADSVEAFVEDVVRRALGPNGGAAVESATAQATTYEPAAAESAV
jgi:hypothetical protein